MTVTTERWRPAFVGVGSNLDAPCERVTAALNDLAERADICALQASDLWASAPVGTGPQPDYINAVAGFLWSGAPDALLEMLLGLEREHGRVRDGVRWAPRRLDLDLLLLSDVVTETPTLTLPHPRMTERAFVLRPLATLAPTLMVPGHGIVSTLLDAVSDQRIDCLGAPA
ncbi:MAG: 2-amino-4-hydroxy-6-hydroxymethyldihydropteridine diphosphokinase [Pseudomonadota bacterium]